MRTFQALALLLSYPEADLVAAAPELRRALDEEGLLPAAARRSVEALLASLERDELMGLQERYVAEFDQGLSLNLTEHTLGQSRERGDALLAFTALYRRHGLEPDTEELPDHLPVFLEFLSTLPREIAIRELAAFAPTLEAVRRRLAERDSPYAAIPAALVALLPAPPAEAEVAAVLKTSPRPPQTAAERDRDWEERPVRFDEPPSTPGGRA